MNAPTKPGLLSALFLIAIASAGIIGWFMNAVAIANAITDNDAFGFLLVMRVFGMVLVPLGAALGYI